MASKKPTLKINNIKGKTYKQFHIDGASAGITPRGYINVNFFGERNIIPKGTLFELNKDGSLGEFIKITDDSKEGIIREYECGAYMDIDTCKNIVALLNSKIEELEKLLNTNTK